MTKKLMLEYECNAETVKVERQWRKVGSNKVREVTKEIGYNFTADQWETTHTFTRDYDIDDNGDLVGDGSNWSGEGVNWEEHAHNRHETLLRKRFPHDFD